MKHHILLIILVCFFSGTLMGEKSIALRKVFFHQGATSDKKESQAPSHIELGNLVFYFEHEPHIESSVVAKGDRTLQRLFLPNVSVSNELKESLQQIHKTTKELSYTMQLNAKEHPRKGLEITFIYPTDKVGVKYNHFQSIGLQKGLAFQFYNKEVIHRINQLGKSIITTASLAPPHVFIDCGHGGTDYGAVAHSIREKDISLEVGLKIADQLRTYGIMVGLSRETDVTIALDQRTSLANKQEADLFVSIHANATTSKIHSGIETYFFNPTLLKSGDCFVLNSFEQEQAGNILHEKSNKSNRLAVCVHDALLKKIRSQYAVKDRRIKSAVSQVLFGTQMPAILVEVGFVTHPQEAKLLSQKSYQQQIACGIASGILHYLGHL